MMQLVCNGEVLDLYDNAAIQFKHENPLFAFDKLSCERTTNFKLPATPKNDRVFGLARIPAYKGEGMRRKFAAQLQAGLVTKDGYLYVSDFDGKDYKVIFVTGELVGLQRIKDLGKLAELDPTDHYPWSFRSNMSPEYASDATFKTSIFGYFHYISEGRMYPSINLGVLMQYVARQNNIQITVPEKAFEMRIALPELRTPEDSEGHIISTRDTEVGDDYVNVVNTEAFLRYLTDPRGLEAKKVIHYRRGHGSVTGEILRTEETSVMVEHLICTNIDIEITFPDDFPSEYFLVRMNPLVSGFCVFLGDYSFTTQQQIAGDGTFTIEGEPLAGRTVEIPAGTSFILIKYAREGSTRDGDYKRYTEDTYIQIDDEPVAVTANVNGWDFSAVDALKYDIQVKISVKEENASEWRLIDNLPDITFTDLLKAVAFELGLVLNYSEAGGLTFDKVGLDDFGNKEINALTKKGEVKRVFSDYAQHNYVQFAEDEVFTNTNFTRKDYIIDNDNIEIEDTLATLPWTCGQQNGQYVRDRLGRTKFLEMRYNTNMNGLDAFFARIEKNADIQRLCDASTQIKVSSRMGLYDYNLITPKSSLLVEGSRYVWTERSWQKDTAQFTLARFAKEYIPPVPDPFPYDEYVKVEFIGGLNDAYINTLLYNDEQKGVKMVLNARGDLAYYFYGTYMPNEWFGFGFSYTRQFITYINSTRTGGGVDSMLINSPMLIEFNYNNSKKVTIYDNADNIIYTSDLDIPNIISRVPITLFAMATGDSSIQQGGNLYQFQLRETIISDNTAIVADFIPCRRISDNRAGMYDIIRGAFFDTPRGHFVAGPDMN